MHILYALNLSDVLTRIIFSREYVIGGTESLVIYLYNRWGENEHANECS